jgi:putative hydrolase of the HAD superfamily
VSDIRAVLFDIGGVIVRMGDITVLGPFNGTNDRAQMMALWLNCANVDAHERGKIDAAEFARRMIETYGIGCTPEEFLARCISWHGDLFPGVEDLISAIHPEVTVACLSNTCDHHWRNMPAAAALRRLFAKQFLSFRMGLMKPEPEIYRAAADELGVRPQEILFFDDSERNVTGARAVGLMAHCVSGIDDARRILGDYGVLRGS